jgi:carboxylate-amine ligase
VKDEFTRHPRPELLRAAKWRAARFGIESDLIDIPGSQLRPAAEVIENLLAFLRPSLEENNEWDELSALVRETIARGTGASRQREVFRRTNSLEAVVDFIIAETEQGTQ